MNAVSVVLPIFIPIPASPAGLIGFQSLKRAILTKRLHQKALNCHRSEDEKAAQRLLGAVWLMQRVMHGPHGDLKTSTRSCRVGLFNVLLR